MPRDAQSQIDGDTQFMGISPRLDAGSLPAGMASEARNMRFRNGVAATRKGVYKPSWINNLTPEIDNRVRPFGEVHGVGVFRNPDSNLEFVVIAADGKAYYTRQGNNPIELALPTGVVLVGEVNFTQAFNKLIMFRGEAFAPLVMSSVVATMVSRFWFGIDPWYVLPKNLPETVSFSQAASFSQIGWFILLGILSGLCGAFFLKSIQKAVVVSAKRTWPSWMKRLMRLTTRRT